MDRPRRKGKGMPAPPIRSKAPPSRRQRTPDSGVGSGGHKAGANSVPTMTRSSMLVMEANEIAQLLKKDYEFKMEAEVSGDENLTRILVHQKKLSVSCVWTLAKLKERLVKMRKLMYADETEGQGFGCETVFFDPKDVWVRDEDSKTPTNENQGHDKVTAENQSDKENIVPNGHHGDSSRSHDPAETLSNEPVLPSVSVSLAVQDGMSTSKQEEASVTPPNLNSNNNQHHNSSRHGNSHQNNTSSRHSNTSPQKASPHSNNHQNNASPHSNNGQQNVSRHSNSSLSMTSSSELPADSEFFTLNLTNSPMSPPLPPKDFGQNSGSLPEKYLAKSSPGDDKQSLPTPSGSGSHDNTDNALTTDPQHSKYTPIIKTRSPNNQTGVSKSPAKKPSKKKDAAISFNLDMQKTPTQKGGVTSSSMSSAGTRDSQGPRIGVSNNWVAVKPRKSDEGQVVANKGKTVSSTTSRHGNQGAAGVGEGKRGFVCERCRGERRGGVERDTAGRGGGRRGGISMLRMCRDMVKTLASRTIGPVRQDLLVDRILYNTEVVKVAVINILEAYTQAQESRLDMAVFADSELVKLTSMQLVAAMELLVSHSSLWLASCPGGGGVEGTDEEGEQWGVVREVCVALHSSVCDLGREMVVFLQACESDHDIAASDSSSRLIDELYELVRCCGELAMATDTCPGSLSEKPQQETRGQQLRGMRQEREDDLIHMKPGQDMKQAFIAGSDLWTDRHLQSGVNALAKCQKQAQILSEDCLANQCSEQVARQIYVTVATIRMMTLKYQDVQVAVSSDAREDKPHSDDYFHHYFLRSQGILVQLSSMVDSTGLLLQAAEPLVDEEEASVLKKVWRCAEMIHNATVKLAFASNMDQSKQFLQTSFSSNSSLNGLSLEMNLPKLTGMSAILSETQCEDLQRCSEDVKLAVHALIAIVKKRLPASAFGASGGSGKVKRMLPATPGAGTGRPMLRCKSAKTHERIRRSQSYYDMTGDMPNFK